MIRYPNLQWSSRGLHVGFINLKLGWVVDRHGVTVVHFVLKAYSLKGFLLVPLGQSWEWEPSWILLVTVQFGDQIWDAPNDWKWEVTLAKITHFCISCYYNLVNPKYLCPKTFIPTIPMAISIIWGLSFIIYKRKKIKNTILKLDTGKDFS